MKSDLPHSSILRSAIVAGTFFLACAAPTFAQGSIPTGSPTPEEKVDLIAEEMRVKRQISQAQKEHKETLNRAQLLSCLSAEIGSTFKQKHHLDRDDLKKLDKLEKLAKSIRSAAGGSADDSEAKELPTDLSATLTKMEEMAEALKEEVEKTPRQVISAAVIDQANVLLELIRRARGLSAKI